MPLILDVGTAYDYPTPTAVAVAADVPNPTNEYGDPITWAEVLGEVPGMTTGTGLTGTPTEAGDYTLTLFKDGGKDPYGRDKPDAEATFTVSVVDPNAVPEPEPGVSTLVPDVLEFLGLPNAPETVKLATQHVRIVTTFVRNYTRGNGFNAEGTPNADLHDVIITATARYLPNPQQATRQSLGNQSIGYATIEGFTLTEKAVLNRYRKMTSRGNIVTTTSTGLTGTPTSYATVQYVDSKVAGIPTTNLDGYATTAYVDDVAASMAVDLNPYATRSYVDVAIDQIPDVDLSAYALKAEIPAPVDLTGYATETYVDAAIDAIPEPAPVDLSGYALKSEVPAAPDLSAYAKTTAVPGLVGVRRSASYTLTQNTVVKVTDVTSSGSVFIIADGDKSPGPLWVQIYRAGQYNSVDKWAGSSNWEIGTTAEPTTGTFRVWVDGQGNGAALCFKSTNNWNRRIRVYWMEM